jgi:hypothetical protein
MTWLIYIAVAALCVWSAYYLARRLSLFLRGRGTRGGCCCGSCDGCPRAPETRERNSSCPEEKEVRRL